MHTHTHTHLLVVWKCSIYTLFSIEIFHRHYNNVNQFYETIDLKNHCCRNVINLVCLSRTQWWFVCLDIRSTLFFFLRTTITLLLKTVNTKFLADYYGKISHFKNKINSTLPKILKNPLIQGWPYECL